MAIFDFKGETAFYAQCIRQLAFARAPATVAEFGPGAGTAVIAELTDVPNVSVRGIEIDAASAGSARAAIIAAGLRGRYDVTLGDFLSQPPQADCLIANPPYLPSCADGPRLTALEPETLALLRQCAGGPTGSEISQELLRLHYPLVMMLVASHADPLAIFRTAREYGYWVTGWLTRPVTFGALHVPVLPVIRELQAAGRAFVLPASETYLLSGVLWEKTTKPRVSDTERSLVACMRGLA